MSQERKYSSVIKTIAILAVDEENNVGVENTLTGEHRLPWFVKEDLTFFKATTWGSTLVMGRKTYESLPVTLHGRNIIVITHKTLSELLQEYGDKSGGYLFVATNIQDAKKLAEEEAPQGSDLMLYVAGGVSVYKDTLPYVDEVLVCRVNPNEQQARPPKEGEMYVKFDIDELVRQERHGPNARGVWCTRAWTVINKDTQAAEYSVDRYTLEDFY